MTLLSDLLHAAAEESPELVEKTAEILSVLEKAEPEMAQEVVDKMNDIAVFTQEKTASVGASVSEALVAGGRRAALNEFGLQAAIGGAGMLVAGLGAAVATDLYDAAKHGLTKARNLRRILAMSPELQNQDPKRVRSAYNALHQFATEFTADPIMGGSILSALSGSPIGMEHQILQNAIKSRKDLQDAKHRQVDFGKNILKG